jgi:hypothetical protein
MMMNWEGFGRKVLARHSHGGTEENLDQDSLSPGPRFELGTSRIRGRSLSPLKPKLV